MRRYYQPEPPDCTCEVEVEDVDVSSFGDSQRVVFPQRTIHPDTDCPDPAHAAAAQRMVMDELRGPDGTVPVERRYAAHYPMDCPTCGAPQKSDLSPHESWCQTRPYKPRRGRDLR